MFGKTGTFPLTCKVKVKTGVSGAAIYNTTITISSISMDDASTYLNDTINNYDTKDNYDDLLGEISAS